MRSCRARSVSGGEIPLLSGDSDGAASDPFHQHFLCNFYHQPQHFFAIIIDTQPYKLVLKFYQVPTGINIYLRLHVYSLFIHIPHQPKVASFVH